MKSFIDTANINEIKEAAYRQRIRKILRRLEKSLKQINL